MLIIDAASPATTPSLIPNISFQFVNLGANAGSVANVTNGSGLTPAIPALTGTHEFYTNSNGVQSGLVGTTWPRILLFTLPTQYWVSGMSYWQAAGGFGVQNLEIQYSLDNFSWLPISGSPTTFPIGSTTIPPTALQFSWEAVRANFIRFVVSSNWAGGRIQLLEVQFAGYL